MTVARRAVLDLPLVLPSPIEAPMDESVRGLNSSRSRRSTFRRS